MDVEKFCNFTYNQVKELMTGYGEYRYYLAGQGMGGPGESGTGY